MAGGIVREDMDWAEREAGRESAEARWLVPSWAGQPIGAHGQGAPGGAAVRGLWVQKGRGEC